MPRRSSYTPEQKQQALQFYDQVGPREAARRTRIPRATISRWATETGRDGTARNQRTKNAIEERTLAARQHELEREADFNARLEQLKQGCLDTLLALRTRIHEAANPDTVEDVLAALGPKQERLLYQAYQRGRREPVAAKDWALSLAILFDKLQLMTGQPTSRSDVTTREAAISDGEQRARRLHAV